jgi:hypothetical protein
MYVRLGLRSFLDVRNTKKGEKKGGRKATVNDPIDIMRLPIEPFSAFERGIFLRAGHHEKITPEYTMPNIRIRGVEPLSTSISTIFP